VVFWFPYAFFCRKPLLADERTWPADASSLKSAYKGGAGIFLAWDTEGIKKTPKFFAEFGAYMLTGILRNAFWWCRELTCVS